MKKANYDREDNPDVRYLLLLHKGKGWGINMQTHPQRDNK